MTVEPSRTRLLAELPPEPRRASARAVGLVALAVDTLAVSLASSAPQTLPALAAPRELLARRTVAVALHAAVPPRPSRVAQAAARHRVAHRVDAAVAVVVALGPPDARVARAFASRLVAFALLARARVLAVGPPAIVVAGALAGQVVALAVGVAVTLPLAVGTPELGRTLYETTTTSSDDTTRQTNARRTGKALTRVTARPKVPVAAAAFVGADAHLVLLAGEVAFAESLGGEEGRVIQHTEPLCTTQGDECFLCYVRVRHSTPSCPHPLQHAGAGDLQETVYIHNERGKMWHLAERQTSYSRGSSTRSYIHVAVDTYDQHTRGPGRVSLFTQHLGACMKVSVSAGCRWSVNIQRLSGKDGCVSSSSRARDLCGAPATRQHPLKRLKMAVCFQSAARGAGLFFILPEQACGRSHRSGRRFVYALWPWV